jgi:hypothetical protein
MYGRLKVSTYDRSAGKPLAGARVRIAAMDAPERAIEELITNESGQTESVELSAPSADYSQEPGSPQPYTQYTLQISADGYDEEDIRGVQVLSDTEALQDAILYPADVNRREEITIPHNTLYGDFPEKEPEDVIKEMPTGSGLVVLPEPVIPEYVVVHAGVPTNSSAPDYWVPFKDYIKNSASSEIYSTWPVETLRANILAIISLTLNRVYTEWYRSKGYNFTITNSTQYDQAFNYGRNIFTEISQVVDEIFENYITRPGVTQPIFTQYCDGKRVQCANKGWMTQWGSKDLGDQGYSAINILRSFYGYEIYLAQAEQVQGVPSSFGGEVLSIGSNGPAVRTIQQQLNAISNNFPAINKAAVDGVYGPDTRQAVQTFQRVFDLPVTGVVDRATWYKISQIYVAVTKIAEGK